MSASSAWLVGRYFTRHFPCFGKPYFSKTNKLKKVKLTNLLTYLFYIFLMKFFVIFGRKLAIKGLDKLFAQKSMSNCLFILINLHGADEGRWVQLVYSRKLYQICLK